MKSKLFSFGLLTASVLFICTGQANAAEYTFTDLGTLGGHYSHADAINNAGQVAGAATSAGDTWYATVWNGNTPTAVGGTHSEGRACLLYTSRCV